MRESPNIVIGTYETLNTKFILKWNMKKSIGIMCLIVLFQWDVKVL